jgi:hypothetical protein
MTFENLKNLFQILTYIGTSLAILGSILITTIPENKLKWAYNIPTGTSVVILGAVLLLIGTIFFDLYSSKIETKLKEENSKKLAERDKIIKIKSEQLTLAYQFNSEISNPINSMFLVFDLGNTVLGNLFDNFLCIIQFKLLNITAQIRSVKSKNQNSSGYFYETSIAKGKYINKSPKVFNSTGSNESLNQVYLDLLTLTHDLPEGFTLKDLNGKSFYIFLTKEQIQFVKGIKLVVNNWDIFNITEDRMVWKDMKQEWLPENDNLKVLHKIDEHDNYTNTNIQFFRNDYTKFEVIRSDITSNKNLNLNDFDQILSCLNENSGTILISIDTSWRIKDNRRIIFLPKTVLNGMSVMVFRDTDNILKVVISYKYAENIILQCKYPENFINKKEYDRLAFAWNETGVKLFINSNEIDRVSLD